MMTMTDFLTIDEIAKILKVHPQTVRRLMRENRLQGGFKVGRSWRFPATAIEALNTGPVEEVQA